MRSSDFQVRWVVLKKGLSNDDTVHVVSTLSQQMLLRHSWCSMRRLGSLGVSLQKASETTRRGASHLQFLDGPRKCCGLRGHPGIGENGEVLRWHARCREDQPRHNYSAGHQTDPQLVVANFGTNWLRQVGRALGRLNRRPWPCSMLSGLWLKDLARKRVVVVRGGS